MKRITKAALVATATAVLGGIVTATPADAAVSTRPNDTRACVTQGEWAQIHSDQRQSTVTTILDGPGRLWYEQDNWDTLGTDRYRIYRPCPEFGNDQALVVWTDNYTYDEAHGTFSGAYRVWDKFRSTNPHLRYPLSW